MTSPAAGTTLNASPERKIVGTDVSASSPLGSCVAAVREARGSGERLVLLRPRELESLAEPRGGLTG